MQGNPRGIIDDFKCFSYLISFRYVRGFKTLLIAKMLVPAVKILVIALGGGH